MWIYQNFIQKGNILGIVIVDFHFRLISSLFRVAVVFIGLNEYLGTHL